MKNALLLINPKQSPTFALNLNEKQEMTDLDTLYKIYSQCGYTVTTDSRHCPAGSLFFALKGDTFDGNAFAAKALEAGCAYAVVDNPEIVPTGDTRYLLTDNSLLTLQALARHHRRRLGTRMLGITGTNGKTTTKELIAAVLQQRYRLLYTEGNLNNAIGVPLTLLRLRPEHELAVVEMGASHPGDIRELVEIAEPDMGLITNVGKAHLEGFGSFEGVMRTKGELYDFLRTRPETFIFLHADNPYLRKMAEGLPCVTYGSEEGTYVRGQMTACSPFLTFVWQKDGQSLANTVSTRLIGSYNLPNTLAAVAVGRYFEVDEDAIDRALEAYTPQNNRSQLMRTADNTLIIDAYNANPTSMMAALDNFRQMETAHKVAILGDMRELGKDSAGEHQKIVDYLGKCGFERVILVGSQFAATRHTYETYADAPALIEALKLEKPVGKTVLIKGSNGIRLSTIIPYL